MRIDSKKRYLNFYKDSFVLFETLVNVLSFYLKDRSRRTKKKCRQLDQPEVLREELHSIEKRYLLRHHQQ